MKYQTNRLKLIEQFPFDILSIAAQQASLRFAKATSSIGAASGRICTFNESADRRDTVSQSSKSNSEKFWIVNPTVDIVFVCGGMLWLLVAFAHFNPSLFSSKTAPAFMLLTQIGAIFFLDAHNAATILRLCYEKELREKHTILWLWGPLVLGLLFALSLSNQTLFLICLKVYISLVPHHITAQSYGICSMYFARAKTMLIGKEVFALKLAFAAMSITSVVRNFSKNSVGELMGVSVPSLVLFPDWLSWCFAGLAWITSLLAFGMIMRRSLRENRKIATGALILALSTLTLLTLGPNLSLAVVFSSAFFHASQYLIVSGLVHDKNAETQASPAMPPMTGHKLRKGLMFWGQTIVLGLLVYLAVPTALSHFGIPVVKAAVAVLCFASLHHFLADALIWRMRDPKVRAVLNS